MDQFVTTYRKDYLWPYIRSFGKKLIEPTLQSTGYDNKCKCHCYPPPAIQHQHHEPINFDTQSQNWSRTGPMGPLLDAKLYPAKVGKSPESDTMRQDQPNMFLRKLHEKYPFLYEILQTSPSANLVSKVYQDRLRTTYQIDYCNMEEYPPDNMLRGNVIGLGPCPEPVRLPGDPYPPQRKNVAFRPATISKTQQSKCSGGTGCSGAGDTAKGGGAAWGGGAGSGANADTGTAVWASNKSEYQDGISKVGSLIIRDRLHFHNRK